MRSTRRRMLSPEQTREVEAALQEAVNFLLSPHALHGLSPSERIAFCGTHLLSKLGDCAPPPQPMQPRAVLPPEQETLQVADDLQRAFKLAIIEAKAGDPAELPMRRIGNSLLQICVALEERSALTRPQAASAAAAINTAPKSSDMQDQLRDLLTKNATRVIDLFRSIDADRSGTVSRAEFCNALEALFESLNSDEEYDPAAGNALFNSIDSDGSGCIAYKELNTALRRGATVTLNPILAPGAAGQIELVAKNKSTKDAETVTMAANAKAPQQPQPQQPQQPQQQQQQLQPPPPAQQEAKHWQMDVCPETGEADRATSPWRLRTTAATDMVAAALAAAVAKTVASAEDAHVQVKELASSSTVAATPSVPTEAAAAAAAAAAPPEIAAPAPTAAIEIAVTSLAPKPAEAQTLTAKAAEQKPIETSRPHTDYTDIDSLYELVRSKQFLLLKASWVMSRAGMSRDDSGRWVRISEQISPLPPRHQVESQFQAAVFTLADWQKGHAKLAQTIARATASTDGGTSVEDVSLARAPRLRRISMVKVNTSASADARLAPAELDEISATPVIAVSYSWEGTHTPDTKGRSLARLASRLAKDWNRFAAMAQRAPSNMPMRETAD